MARISSYSSTTPTSETNIAFFSAGGHSHDGSNSSLIDGSKYSIFDFDQGLIPTNSERAQTQQRNKINFEDNVKEILRTAGIELSANSINATQIIAGSITSEEIAANTITANNIASETITTDLLAAGLIQSKNLDLTNWVFYSLPFSDAGTFFDLASGTIVSTAFAVYPSVSQAFIKGTINADGGYIGNDNYGFDITSTSTSATMSSIDFATDGGGSRGKLFLHSYGDIDVYSSPVSGPHSGQNWVTFLEGEYIFIGRTDSGTQDQVYIGNTSGLRGTEMSLTYNAAQRAILQVTSSGMGRLIVGNGSTAVYVNGSGSIVCNSLNVGSISASSINSSSHNHDGVYEPVHSHPYLSSSGGSLSGSLSISGNIRTTGHANIEGSYNRNVQNGTEHVVYINGDGWVGKQASSRKVKRNIEALDYGLPEILKLNPVRFEYINTPGMTAVGFIAEEVKEVMQELVMYDDTDEDYIPSVHYDKFVIPLVSAVQQLSRKVNELQSQLDSLS